MATWAEIEQAIEDADRIRVDRHGLRWVFDSEQEPTDTDRSVAWELCVELRTRITTQSLHFLDGDESTALTSVFNLFQPTRELLKRLGPDCRRTAAVIETMLNRIIRPFTANWHRRKLAGEFARDDVCREFRGQLGEVRANLQMIERLLCAIARREVHADSEDQPQQGEAESPGSSISFDRLLGLPATDDWNVRTAAIIELEKQEVKNRRHAVRQQEIQAGLDGDQIPSGSDDLVGLAVSGGGIRSATFALGVVQGLVKRNMLRHVDVMSTVSGGGYLGGFLSSILNTDSAECGPGPRKIPFRADVAGDSGAIRELRNHSRYIQPSTFWRWLMAAGQTTYGVVSNLIILSTLVFAAVLATHYFQRCQQSTLAELYTCARSRPPIAPPRELWTMSRIPLFAWVLTALMLLALPTIQRVGRIRGDVGAFSRFWEWTTLASFLGSFVATAIEYLPLAHYSYFWIVDTVSDLLNTPDNPDGWSIQATGMALLNAGGVLAARSVWVHRVGKSYPRLRQCLIGILWLAGPALFVFAYFELCRVYVADPPLVIFSSKSLGLSVGAPAFLWTLLGTTVLYALTTNVNFTSLHRFYRNRLAETYLLRRHADGSIRSTESPPRTQQLLSAMRASERSTAPYHLLNAALNLPASTDAELRGRDCDFFLFSKHFCGSRVMGYQPTKRWEKEDPHLDLGTSVAISGAAAGPQMGMGSIRRASFLLALLNVRLGYWLKRPGDKSPQLKPADESASALRWFSAPGPVYLLREAFNRMTQNAAYINLSDGGHVENLGIYELLRRRCRYVIAIDGECDAALNGPGLMKLHQFAAVDLGVTIEMNVDRLKWIEFIPTKGRPRDDERNADAIVRSVRDRIRYSRGHFAVGKIHYPPDDHGNPATGWLIYMKLSVTGNEPDYIADYRRRHPEFPHESTADQVFEEDQFEAYRCLGEHITNDLFSDELLTQQARDQAGDGNLSVQEWFRNIARNFFPGSQ